MVRKNVKKFQSVDFCVGVLSINLKATFLQKGMLLVLNKLNKLKGCCKTK